MTRLSTRGKVVLRLVEANYQGVAECRAWADGINLGERVSGRRANFFLIHIVRSETPIHLESHRVFVVQETIEAC